MTDKPIPAGIVSTKIEVSNEDFNRIKADWEVYKYRALWLGIRRGVMQIIAALDAYYGVKDK